MKNIDRPLIAIVVAIVVLLVVAVIVVLSEPPPEYMPEGEPQAAAYNYLLALIKGDFEKAYGYLSPALLGYPDNLDDFIHEIRRNPYRFGLDRDITFSVEDVFPLGLVAYVTIQETRFSSSDVLSPSYNTRSFEFEVSSEQGEWHIQDADRYFSRCWNDPDLYQCD
jgi:hypothetical protein